MDKVGGRIDDSEQVCLFGCEEKVGRMTGVVESGPGDSGI